MFPIRPRASRARSGSRLILALLAFAAANLLGGTRPAISQYMYLDANGDAVNTASDRMNPAGVPTTVDIWLFTDHNRDGSQAVCSNGGALSLTSYEFILHAEGGPVQYGTFTNLVPGLPTSSETEVNNIEFCTGQYGGSLEPGLYHLGTLTVTAQLGAPSLQFRQLFTGMDGICFTGFGTACTSADLDNTFLLGTDWFDADGLGRSLTGNAVPTLTAPAAMASPEGAAVNMVAHGIDSDASDVLTFSQSGMPTSLTFSSTPASGHVTATISGALGYADAGTHEITWMLSDGVNAPATAVTSLRVLDTNRPPLLVQPSHMSVSENGVAIQELSASDPDGPAFIDFTKNFGPDFMTVRRVDLYTGEIKLEPREGVVHGPSVVFEACVCASDGFLHEMKTFQITVTHEEIPAAVLLQPQTINVKSGAKWLTAVVEPAGVDPSRIDLSTLRLAGSIAPEPNVSIADGNANGVPDLTAKFGRAALYPFLVPGMNEIEVTGSLFSGEPFRGHDDVRVTKIEGAAVSPNPINPSGVLLFSTSREGPARIAIFDVHGRLVRVLMDAQGLPAGFHQVPIDGRDLRGQVLATGIYFYRVTSVEGTVTGRIGVLK